MNGFECGDMQGGGPGFKGCTEQCEECRKNYPNEDDIPFDISDNAIVVGPPLHKHFNECSIGTEVKIEGHYYEYGTLMGLLVRMPNGESSIYHWNALSNKKTNTMNNTEVKRIPFDMERAKKGDKVVNGNGEIVRLICFDRDEEKYPLVGIVDNNRRDILSYSHNGIHDIGDYPSSDDLFMAPVEKSGWIAIIRHKGTGSVHISDCIYGSKEDAMKKEYDTIAFSIVDITQISWTE